jgi:hypothetical protein
MDFRKWLEQTAIPASQDTARKVHNYLQQLVNSGFQLIAHQTAQDSAMRILAQGQDFGQAGVGGTALLATPESLRQTIDMMQSGTGAAAGGTSGIHRGADAVLIMAVPQGFRDINELDEYLFDMGLTSIPNNHIVGIWNSDGTFRANGKFNPTTITL